MRRIGNIRFVRGMRTVSALLVSFLSVAFLAGCLPQDTLTIAVTGNGTVDPPVGTHQYPNGTTVTLQATPAAMYHFDRWEGAVTGSDNPATLQVTGNATVTAVFVETPWEADTSTFDVQLAPDVVEVDLNHQNLVVQSDIANHVYTLDAAGVQSTGLDVSVGKVLIIDGVDVRRISAVQTVGNTLVAQTDFVPLNEVIPNGTVSWDRGIEFTPDVVKSIEVPGEGVFYPKAGTPIDITLTVGDYDYEIKATLDTTTTTFEITGSKVLGAATTAKVVASGFLERFRSKDTIQFQNGQCTEFGHELNSMKGEATLELIVAASGQDAVNLKFPVTIMKIPFVVGFIPMVLNVKIQFVINAVVPFDASAHVKAKFTYDSDLGFAYNGTDVSAGGRLGSILFGQDTNQTGASNAISANFGIGFPRVELNILHDSAVTWAQTAFLIGGSYTFMPACQTADAQFIGSAGYSLGLFGVVNVASGSKQLFSEKKPLLRSGQCPASAKSDGISELEQALSGEPVW